MGALSPAMGALSLRWLRIALLFARTDFAQAVSNPTGVVPGLIAKSDPCSLPTDVHAEFCNPSPEAVLERSLPPPQWLCKRRVLHLAVRRMSPVPFQSMVLHFSKHVFPLTFKKR